MILEFVKQWEEKKHLLKKSFEEKEPEDYEDIYKELFKIVITKTNSYNDEWDWDRYRCIDDGDYQGNYIFILCNDAYQPSLEDYIFTNVNYGSCSGCDTFQVIKYDYSEEEKEEKIRQYMLLALNILQETKTFKIK
jgi:hypothetical protein